jgi:predicted nucleotidyltransferase
VPTLIDILINEKQAKQINQLFQTHEEFVEAFYHELHLVLQQGGIAPELTNE